MSDSTQQIVDLQEVNRLLQEQLALMREFQEMEAQKTAATNAKKADAQKNVPKDMIDIIMNLDNSATIKVIKEYIRTLKTTYGFELTFTGRKHDLLERLQGILPTNGDDATGDATGAAPVDPVDKKAEKAKKKTEKGDKAEKKAAAKKAEEAAVDPDAIDDDEDDDGPGAASHEPEEKPAEEKPAEEKLSKAAKKASKAKEKAEKKAKKAKKAKKDDDNDDTSGDESL